LRSAFASYHSLRDLDAGAPATDGDKGLTEDDNATVAGATQDDRVQVGTDAQEQLSPEDQEDVGKAIPKTTGAEPFSGNGPLTPAEAMSALEAFREQVIRSAFPEWDARRSILRPAMIETFVQQRVVDPDEWHRLVPQYLRTGTNAAEKNRFLDEICEIMERIHVPTSWDPVATTGGMQVAAPPRAIVNAALDGPSIAQVPYAAADPAKVGRPDRGRFYDGAYSTTLKTMIAHVIDAEGPIFEDVLVDRIARAHGMQRSGNQIRRRVIALLPARVSRIAEGERTVVWPSSKDAGLSTFSARTTPECGVTRTCRSRSSLRSPCHSSDYVWTTSLCCEKWPSSSLSAAYARRREPGSKRRSKSHAVRELDA
jgi:Protein of unknown function (DUF3320)